VRKGDRGTRGVMLVVDDQWDPRREVAFDAAGMLVIARANSVEAILRHWTGHHRDDVAVVVGPRPGSIPEKDVAEIVRRAPSTPVVVLANPLREIELLSVLQAGAVGYLPDDLPPDKLAFAVAAVLEGEVAIPRHIVRWLVSEFHTGLGRVTIDLRGGEPPVELSNREWEVVCLLRQGMSTRKIAENLYVSPTTVRSHIASVVRKLGVSDRNEALQMLDER
jgi:DNA-binding NarL/FixJ family response regulator